MRLALAIFLACFAPSPLLWFSLAAAALWAAEPPPVDPALPDFVAGAEVRGELSVARSRLDSRRSSIPGAAALPDSAPGSMFTRRTPSPTFRSNALSELTDGSVQLAPFVREIQPSEREIARQKLGYEPLGIAIASGSYATPSNTHAIAIYVNAANPLLRLSLPQLDAIYSSTRRRGFPSDLSTWGQLGLPGEWTGEPIHIYGMVVNRKVGNPHAGIVAYLIERLMLGGDFKAETRQVPDTGMGRGNNRALDEIVQAVAADRDAIGYAGFANRLPGTKTIALAESDGQPYYEGTRDEVARRLYPLTRTIFVFVRRPPGQSLDPALREFLRYLLSRQGQQAVADDPANFLPLPAAFADAERTRLN